MHRTIGQSGKGTKGLYNEQTNNEAFGRRLVWPPCP